LVLSIYFGASLLFRHKVGKEVSSGTGTGLHYILALYSIALHLIAHHHVATDGVTLHYIAFDWITVNPIVPVATFASPVGFTSLIDVFIRFWNIIAFYAGDVILAGVVCHRKEILNHLQKKMLLLIVAPRCCTATATDTSPILPEIEKT